MTPRPRPLLGRLITATVLATACTLAGTLAEYAGDGLARARRTGERLPVALWRLAGAARRRYGGLVVHLGVVMLALGVIGTRAYGQEERRALARGVSQAWGAYTIVYEGPTADRAGDAIVQRATFTLARRGRDVAALAPDLCVTAGTYNPKRLLHHLGYFEDVRNFLAAAAGTERDRCPVGDTIKTMELVEQIYTQCRQRGAPE